VLLTLLTETALRVCEAFLASEYRANRANGPRPFIYVSAEDIFRPVVPARYIETKREAERRIAEMLASDPAYRAVFIRPGMSSHSTHFAAANRAQALSITHTNVR